MEHPQKIVDWLEQIDGNAVVLVATSRLLKHAQQRFAQRQHVLGNTVWETPQIFTWYGYLVEQYRQWQIHQPDAPRLLGNSQERLLWQTSLKRIQRNNQHNEFLDRGSTARSAQRSYLMMQEWQISLEQLSQQSDQDAQLFAKWIAAFKQTCESHGWLDNAGLNDWALADMSVCDNAKFVWLGFDGFNVTQQIWQQKTSALGCEHIDLAINKAAEPESIAKYSQSSTEFRGVFTECRRALEQNQDARIAVVIPRLEQCLAQAKRAARQVFYPNTEPGDLQHNNPFYEFSLGVALGQYPMIAAAFDILSALGRSLSYQQVSALLDNPWSLLGANNVNRKLLNQLRKQASSTFSLSYLHERLISLNEQGTAAEALNRLKGIQSALPAKQSPGQWVEIFANVLDQAGWCNAAVLDPEEFQQREAWDTVLRDCASLSGIRAKVNLSEALQMLRDLCSTPFQVQSTGAPLQVMGALEMAGQSHDQVWLTGMNDQDWPGPMRPHPFVPVALQREAGVSEADPEQFYQRAMRITDRLISSAPDIHLSFASGSEELGPSRLISNHVVREAEYSDAVQPATLQSVQDDKGPVDQTSPSVRGGTGVFKNQSQCPFRAYAIHRLGAVRETEQELGLDPSERGTLVHKVLEHFWKQGDSQTGLSDSAASAGKLALAVDATLAEQTYPAGGLRAAQRELERSRLIELVGRWLEVEKNRTPSFEIEQTERVWEGDLFGIELRFVLDRVDRLESGQQLIIDYKTGNPSVHDWFKDRPEEPQLPLYFVALSQQQSADGPAGLAFGVINSKKSKLDGVVEGYRFYNDDDEGAADKKPGRTRSTPIECWAELQAHWRQVIERLAEEFKAGNAEVKPSSASVCRYCDLGEVCRIQQVPFDDNE